MRDKRLEEDKQKGMNSKEYKEYLTSKKESTEANKKQKLLYNQKLKEIKDLQKQLQSEGKLFSDKEGITNQVDKILARQKAEYNSDTYRDNWIKERTAEKQEGLGKTDFKDLSNKIFQEGKKLGEKKSSVVQIPTGQSKKFSTIIRDFGLNDTWNLRLGLEGGKKNVGDQAKQIFSMLDKVGDIQYSRQTKKFKGKPNDYEGYKTLFNKLIKGEVQGPPSVGVSAEDKAKALKIKKTIADIKNSLNNTFKSDDSPLLKQVKAKVGDQIKKNIKEGKDVKGNVAQEVKDFQKQQLGIDNEGRPTTRTDLLNNRLIRAKTIIENIEGLDKKLILSRELKRDK